MVFEGLFTNFSAQHRVVEGFHPGAMPSVSAVHTFKAFITRADPTLASALLPALERAQRHIARFAAESRLAIAGP